MASLVMKLLTVALLVTMKLGTAATGQDSCSTGNAVSLSVSHRTNSSGHTILNGRIQQPAATTWHLDIGLQTSSCGNAQCQTKEFTFDLTGFSSRRVPPGYVLRQGFGYFRASTNSLNWMAARDACAREGAHLAFANSQEEVLMLTRDFNFNVPESRYKDWVWYGASDFEEEGKFVTVTGVPLKETGHTTFHPRQPDGGKGQNCICIQQNQQTLWDCDCPDRMAYICKIPL